MHISIDCDLATVDEFHGGPNRDGGKRVEDFLEIESHLKIGFLIEDGFANLPALPCAIP